MLTKMKRIAVGVTVCLALTAMTRAADQSSPKAAALAFTKALVAGDEKTVKETSVGDEAAYKNVNALGKVVSSIKKLTDAADAKFGKDNELSTMFKDMDVEAKMNASEEKVDGDTATIIQKDDPNDKNPMKLVKKDGKWFVDLAAMPVEETEQVVKMAPAMSKAADQTTTDIKADKFKTAGEAKQAFTMKMIAAMQEGAAPAPTGEGKQ